MTLEHFEFALEQQKVERISQILSQFLGSSPSKEKSPVGCGEIPFAHISISPPKQALWKAKRPLWEALSLLSQALSSFQ